MQEKSEKNFTSFLSPLSSGKPASMERSHHSFQKPIERALWIST
jgi:hypothetical protein